MYTEELLVHDGRERQGTERLGTCVIYPLRIFVLAFELEGEVVGQVAAFMVATQKPERVWVPDL